MDKKNILNKYILRTQIRERLEYRKECLEYIAIRLKHIEINDKVGKEFYQKKPIVSFILKLYFCTLILKRIVCFCTCLFAIVLFQLWFCTFRFAIVVLQLSFCNCCFAIVVLQFFVLQNNN